MVAEITFDAAQPHPKPFLDVTLDVVFTDPAGAQKTVPAFWAGGKQWKVRYSSPIVGTHRYRTQCNETGDTGLHAVEGRLEITPYRGDNPFFKHGPPGVGKGGRHFAHADGTPFFWLGDTWWKCLCKRMTWEGFQELTADRKAKGFTVVQIVCGPYPDEGFLEPRLANEGGLPYESMKFDERQSEVFRLRGSSPEASGGRGHCSGDCGCLGAWRLQQHGGDRSGRPEAALAVSRGALQRLSGVLDSGG